MLANLDSQFLRKKIGPCQKICLNGFLNMAIRKRSDADLDLLEDEDQEDQEERRDHLDFSISDINIKTEQQSGHFIIDMLRHNEINMQTPFQRSSDLWKTDVMSRFIESMMLKFPIPPFYFDISYKINADGTENEKEPFWQVVDGLQRLSAIRRFVIGDDKGRKLKLRGLDFFGDLEGATYDTLPRNLKRNIDACQISMFVIYPNTPKSVKHRIFERVNTGGLKLNDQEIRHALNQGRPPEILAAAVKKGLVDNGIKIDPGRMKDEELALRFLAFNLLKPNQYGNSMKSFLDDAMEALATVNSRTEKNLIQGLSDSVAIAKELFGPLAFRKQEGTAINKSLFDSYTYAISALSRQERALLLDNKLEIVKRYKASLAENAKNRRYLESISSATARIENVRMRFSVAQAVLSGGM